MRKSKQEAAQTRERIVSVAASEFRRHGIVSSGIADLMAAAGLTNGGFYRHFDSKDQLIAEASAAAISQIEALMTNAAQKEGLEGMVNVYLSKFHRDTPQQGCFFGALGSELGRADGETRENVTDGYLALVDLIASQIKGIEPAQAKQQAMLTLFTMIGALTMSRIVTDEMLSDSILATTADSLKKTIPHASG